MASLLRYSCAILTLLTWKVVANPAIYTPVVDLGYAKYAGSFNATRGTTQFLGIRYAAPPTGQYWLTLIIWNENSFSKGSLRWQPPHPPATTPGTQAADSEPSACFFSGQGNQATSPFKDKKSHRKRDLSFTEDCLFLKWVIHFVRRRFLNVPSVYLPGQISSAKKLPVVVWIHGWLPYPSVIDISLKNCTAVVICQEVHQASMALISMTGMLSSMKPMAGSLLLSFNTVLVSSVSWLAEKSRRMVPWMLGCVMRIISSFCTSWNPSTVDQQFALQWVQKNVCITMSNYIGSTTEERWYRSTFSMEIRLVSRSGANPQVGQNYRRNIARFSCSIQALGLSCNISWRMMAGLRLLSSERQSQARPFYLPNTIMITESPRLVNTSEHRPISDIYLYRLYTAR